jgi:predicted membrane-bound spermidine synthase
VTLAAEDGRAGSAAGPSPAQLRLAGVLFFLSGAAALVYQVAWQRILALHSGVGMYSITMIVGAFMAGLGAGSHLGGALSARTQARAALRVFAALEIGIAAFGALSCFVYYDWLYLQWSGLYASPWRAGVLHFAALALPTGLMGMSLPFLVRGLVWDAAAAGRTVGYLYGVNLLGASGGALVTPWVLIRFAGIRGAVFAAALANLLAGVLAIALSRSVSAGPADALDASEAGPHAAHPRAHHAFPLWLALYALSGFCALSLEIVWFRVMDVAVKSMAFTFGTVLFIYLLGSGLGSLLGTRVLARLGNPLQAFLLAQCTLLAYSGAVLALLAVLPPDAPLYRWYFEYWRLYDGFKLGQDWDLEALLKLYFVLPLVVYGPPTLLMGLSFPVLQHAVHDDPRTSGRKVGFLQAANILGCVAGSLLVGLLSLTWLGTTGTVRALLAVGLFFAAIGLVVGPRRSAFAAAAGVLALLVWSFPGQERFWLPLHGRSHAALVDEDATGVGAVTRIPWSPKEWNLSFNGKGQGSLPFFAGHVVMGAVPAIVHPAPRAIAIIGLGTGGTAWAAACRKTTERLRVFELSGSQPRLLRRMIEVDALPEVHYLFRDPRVELIVADGRNALEQDDTHYDVIEQDPIFPDRAYSGNLYSLEFFKRCARKLKPGGILCSWAPTPRIFAALARAFPHLVGTPNRVLVLASNEPIPIDVRAWTARLETPEIGDYLGERYGSEVDRRLRRLQPLALAAHKQIPHNDDLFPRDEFLSRD